MTTQRLTDRLLWLSLALALFWPVATSAEDWPTYQHDNRRSGFSSEKLQPSQLTLRWSWRSPYPPQPAWAGPAKWDAYARNSDLPAMRNYDLAFHPIAVRQNVYFGSSSDHAIHCLSAEDGSQRWSFTIDAPIRIAPSYADGKLYFGGDDGAAYCLDANSGSLLWRFSPTDTQQRILNNGQFISPHPCRTGVLVDGGLAYFGNALLPWNDSYLCAVDALTGSVDVAGGYVKKHAGLTFEGPPALASQWLAYPQGRVAPRIFSRSDGGELGKIKSTGGGSVVVVTLDSKLFHGPAADPRKGSFQSSDPKSLEMIAKHGRAKTLVVSGNISYMLTGDLLVASDLATRKQLWKVACRFSYSLIGLGDALIAGGEDELAAFDLRDGSLLWREEVEGKVFGLAAANGRLLASTDTGMIYAFAASEGSTPKPLANRDAGRPKPDKPVNPKEAPPEATTNSTPKTGIAAGPWLRFDSPGEATVRWRTTEPCPTLLTYRLDEQSTTRQDSPAKTEHMVHLTGLKHRRAYSYTIQTVVAGQKHISPSFLCDTFFNYSVAPISPETDERFGGLSSAAALRAKQILKHSGAQRGICLLLGVGQGRLAYHLARHSSLRVIALETDPQRVQAARAALQSAQVYGQRVTVHLVGDLSDLPLVGRCANLVVVNQTDDLHADLAAEVSRVLRPDGGVSLLGLLASDEKAPIRSKLRSRFDSELTDLTFIDDSQASWARVQRRALPGAGQWSHIYCSADNSAFGGETLGGARTVDDLQVQWLGRPGPRYQADRSGRKPSPLSTSGRLYLQGLERIVTLDAYNGSVLWALEIPGFKRFNMPRDCSNWCADSSNLYAVVGQQCWQIDAANGNVKQMFDLVAPADDTHGFAWSFVARVNHLVVGGSTARGASWTDFWGGKGWYDARSGEVTDKVCSDNLYAINLQDLDTQTAKRAWNYSRGVIINSSVTIAEGRVFFVECRNSRIKAAESRRFGGGLWQDLWLVALDAKSGAIEWEMPIDTHSGDVIFYMAHSQGRLVTVASSGKKFYVNAFSDSQGESLWEQTFRWMDGKEDHGKAISRPAIVGDSLYIKPRVLSLASGEFLKMQNPWPWSKCGTYSCTANSLFFRTRTVTMWDRASATSTTWPRLRPDCWVSTIPAAGMLLSPEGGGGCSCGEWLETSIGFAPVEHAKPE